MGSLPSYNKRVSQIIVRWKLEGGFEVALEAPLPLEGSRDLQLLLATLEDVLENLERDGGQDHA